MGRLGMVRAAALALMVAGCAGSGGAWASGAGGPEVRIAAGFGVPDVAAGGLVALAGNVPSRVVAGGVADLGAAATDRKLPLMSLRFQMTDEQQAALVALIAAQQNPASAQYQRWLSPEQFGARFGLAASDRSKVSEWLAAQGFTVVAVARGGLFVQFSGTVGKANRAFHVELHDVTVGGERHIANLTSPSVPEELSGVVVAVTGLDDLAEPARVQVVDDPAGQRTATPSAAGEGAGLQPEYTLNGVHTLAPGDFYTIYDENALLSGSITGAGVTIAVLGQTDINLADIAAFRAAAGLGVSAPVVALYGADPGTTNAADLLQAETAIEWVGAAAPGATVLYVNSASAVDGSLTSAIDNNVAPIIADTYGQCEAGLGVAKIVYYNQTLQMAAAEGITVVGAAGGHGATDCDVSGASATQGLAVDFPASSPYVTGVGGTEFNEGTATYFGAANGAHGGSALSYIPEKVWNDDSATAIAAGGGGASLYFSKPSWQQNKGVPVDYSRDVPDVALTASASHDGYLVCLPGDCTNGFQSATGAVDAVGGTPLAAATFAGLMALVEQKIGARLGVANPVLYALGGSSYAGNVFHDIATGTNASPCTTGSTGCAAGGTIGYAATAGYDLATGWGSVDAFNLVNDWKLVTALATTGGVTATYTNVAGSASPVAAGTAVTLTATVVSAVSTVTGTPTGTMQFTVDGAAVGTAGVATGTPAGTGTAVYILATGGLSVGTHTVQATYLGDGTYAGSKGAFVLKITTNTPPDFTLTPAAATLTVAAGGISPTVTFTVAAVNGFQGSIAFTASATTTLAAQYSFSVNPVVLSSTAASGTTTFLILAYTPAAKAPLGP